MEIQSRAEQNTVILTLSGQFTQANRRDVKQAIQTAQTSQPNQVVLDLTNVPFMDSAAMGFLMSQTQQLKRERIALVLVGPQKHVRSQMELLKIPEAIQVVGSVNEALSNQKEPTQGTE